MRFIISFGFALCMMPVLVGAENAVSKRNHSQKSAFSGELLSYNQLRKLSREKRMKYLRDTVELLSMMESFNGQYVVADNAKIDEMREQVAQLIRLMQLLPEAEAEAGNGTTPFQVKDIIPAWTGTGWSCGPGAQFDIRAGACFVQRGYFTDFSLRPADSEGENNNDIYCPPGTKEVPHNTAVGRAACIPQANWALLSPERRQAIQKGSPNFGLLNQSPEEQKKQVLGPSRKSILAVAPQPNAPPVSAPQQQEQPQAVTTAATETPGESTAPAASEPAAPPNQEQCLPAYKTCDQVKNREELITRFRSTNKYKDIDANVCAAAGFLSSYRGSIKKPSNCSIPTEYVFTQTLPDGKKKSATLTCNSPNKVICNPALFCLVAKVEDKAGQPKDTLITLCADRKGDSKNLPLTENCAQKYKSMLDGETVDYKDENQFRGLKGKALEAARAKVKRNYDLINKSKREACDPEEMAKNSIFKESWTELIEKTKKLRDVWCRDNSDFAALFCRECQIVNDQIYKMNKDATGSGCAASTTSTEPAPQPPGGGAAGAVREGQPNPQ